MKSKQMNLRFVTYPVERASSVVYKSRRCDARAINPSRFVYCSTVSSVAPQSEFPQWLFGSSWTNWQDIQTKIHSIWDIQVNLLTYLTRQKSCPARVLHSLKRNVLDRENAEQLCAQQRHEVNESLGIHTVQR